MYIIDIFIKICTLMLLFMFSTDQGAIVTVFQSRFERITHTYPTRFHQGNFNKKYFKHNPT